MYFTAEQLALHCQLTNKTVLATCNHYCTETSSFSTLKMSSPLVALEVAAPFKTNFKQQLLQTWHWLDWKHCQPVALPFCSRREQQNRLQISHKEWGMFTEQRCYAGFNDQNSASTTMCQSSSLTPLMSGTTKSLTISSPLLYCILDESTALCCSCWFAGLCWILEFLFTVSDKPSTSINSALLQSALVAERGKKCAKLDYNVMKSFIWSDLMIKSELSVCNLLLYTENLCSPDVTEKFYLLLHTLHFLSQAQLSAEILFF